MTHPPRYVLFFFLEQLIGNLILGFIQTPEMTSQETLRTNINYFQISLRQSSPEWLFCCTFQFPVEEKDFEYANLRHATFLAHFVRSFGYDNLSFFVFGLSEWTTQRPISYAIYLRGTNILKIHVSWHYVLRPIRDADCSNLERHRGLRSLYLVILQWAH